MLPRRRRHWEMMTSMEGLARLQYFLEQERLQLHSDTSLEIWYSYL